MKPANMPERSIGLTVIVPVMEFEKRDDDGGVKLRLARVVDDHGPCIVVFTSEVTYLNSEFTDTAGLRLSAGQLLALLNKDDWLALDPGSQSAARWSAESFAALVLRTVAEVDR